MEVSEPDTVDRPRAIQHGLVDMFPDPYHRGIYQRQRGGGYYCCDENSTEWSGEYGFECSAHVS